MNKTQSRQLHLDAFRERSKPIQSYEDIGEGVKLAYGRDSEMRIVPEIAPICHGGAEALHLVCDARGPGEWLSLEIDVDTRVKRLNMRMRYAPAEQAFLSAIGFVDGKSTQHNLEAIQIPDHDFDLRLEILPILERFAARPDMLRLMILFPEQPWFRLAIGDISEVR